MGKPQKKKKNGKYVKNSKGEYRWRIDYKLPNGKWTSGNCWAKTIEEVYQEIARRQNKVEPTDKLTWKTGHAIWDNAHDKPGASYRSDSYRETIAHTIKLFIEMHGNIPISETTKGQLNQFFNDRAKVSGVSANRSKRILAVANWLRKFKDIEFKHRPDDFLSFDETPAKARREFPLEQIPLYIKIMTHLPKIPPDQKQYSGNLGKYKNAGALILRFLFLTGVRSSEACNLKETDLVDNTLTFLQKGRRERKLIINTEILKVIEASIRRKRRFSITHPYIFFNSRGHKWTENTIRHYWRRRIKLANERGVKLEYRLIHEIRHTFCSVGASLNFSEKMIQSASGHASVEALRRYTHSMSDMQIEVTNAVSAKLCQLDHISASV